jgi:polyphosphate kinase 2 (PPK2 family)
LQKRIDNPESSWKHDPSDLTDREIWPLYQDAYEDVLRETSRPHAPWYVIPADVKWVRDLAVAKIVLDALQRMDPRLPPPKDHLKGVTVV